MAADWGPRSTTLSATPAPLPMPQHVWGNTKHCASTDRSRSTKCNLPIETLHGTEQAFNGHTGGVSNRCQHMPACIRHATRAPSLYLCDASTCTMHHDGMSTDTPKHADRAYSLPL